MNTNRTQVLPRRLRSLASILIIVHLGLFVATLSTAVLDWNVRDRLVDIATPYTAAMHLELGGRALADATHTTADWPHHLQYRMPDQVDWQDCDLQIGGTRYWLGGLGGTERYERYLATIAEAAEREDTATAAMLAEPLVANLMRKLQTDQQDNPSLPQSEFRDGQPASENWQQYFQLRVVASEVVGPVTDQTEVVLPSVALADDVLPSDFNVTEKVRWQAGVVAKPKLTDASEKGWSVVYLEEDRLNAKAVSSDRTQALSSALNN